jgi:predicted dehydrogenase
MGRSISRRDFVTKAAVLGAGLPLMVHAEHALADTTPESTSDKAAPRLTFACIGMGGQMRGYLLPELAKIDQQVVAICDVDQRQIDATRQIKGMENVRVYRDFRELLDKEKEVSGVLIATPDHWHVPISLESLRSGKHVYCEKPLAHSVEECHALEAMARQHPELATQTGNQGCSTEGFRRSFEVIRAGVLGPVTEVHVWHPAHSWPHAMDRPAGADPIPEGLDWDSWLGSAPKRPYKEGIYHPGTWRGWYDFGGGSLADFCCHGFQLAYRALDLDAPTQVDSEGDALGFESFPSRCKVTFEFAAKGDRGPVKLVFYSGDNYLPPVEVTQGPVGTTGCLIVGRDGMLSAGLWNTDCNVRLRGEKEFRGMDHPAVQQVAKTEPRIDTEVLKWDPRRTAKGQRPRWSQVNNSHMFEWVLACAGDAKTYSPFEIGARITEVGMLGVQTLR